LTHRAESIVAKVLTTVTSLTTTGANAFRGRVFPLQTTEVPAVFVYQGADEIMQHLLQGKLDSLLTVHLEAVVKAASASIDTTLNKIREEVTIALQADYTQGLAYVIDTKEIGADAPELSGDGDQRTGTMRMTWQIHYRRSRADPGA
jgi:hypothetical protein